MAESYRDEVAKLEALYEEHPEGRVFMHLAEAYRKTGQLDRARELLDTGMRSYPDYASAHVVLGRVLLDQGDTQGGEASFQRVLELDPGNLVALRALGEMAEQNGRPADALDYFRQLRSLEPADDELDDRIAALEAAVPGAAEAATDAGAADTAVDAGAADTAVDTGAADTVEIAQPDAPAGDEGVAQGVADAGAPGADAADDDAAATGPAEEFIAGFEATELSFDAGLAPADEPDEPVEPIVSAEPDEPIVSEEPDEPAALDEPDELDETEELELSGFGMFGDAGAEDEFDAAPEDDFDAAPEDELEAAPEEEFDAGAEEEFAVGAEDAVDAAESTHEEPAAPAAESPAEGERRGVVTETMAELYARQGLYDRAADIYRTLLDRRPGDDRLRDRLRDVERQATDATATGGPDAGPTGASGAEAAADSGADVAADAGADAAAGAGPDAAAATGADAAADAGADAAEPRPDAAAEGIPEDAWLAGDAEAPGASPESVEAAWTAGDGVAGAEVTPYTWAEDDERAGSVEPSGVTVGQYFETLLAWTPAERVPAAPGRQAASEQAEGGDEFDRLFSTESGAAAESPSDAGADASDIAGGDASDVAGTGAADAGGGPADAGGEDAAQPEAAAEDAAADDDDDDLEAFREWLQNLKR